ncbi:MAG: hypothetical protein WAP08_09365 [Smithellaceae bacterium]|jgi:hypothetical protein|nr:hypothetical protein [Syntrophaceae bacterium]
MNGTIRYCVVKKRKGLLKRQPIYTHLFFIPIDPKKYMYLALIGKDVDDQENTYAAQLLVKLTDEIMDDTLAGEYEYFGKKFIELEALKCKSTSPSQGKYVVTIPKKGDYIKSNLEIEYQVEYSTVEKRIYLLKGELNLVSGDIAAPN